jgi:hypothetical protein
MASILEAARRLKIGTTINIKRSSLCGRTEKIVRKRRTGNIILFSTRDLKIPIRAGGYAIKRVFGRALLTYQLHGCV